MADRITSPDENINDESVEKVTPKKVTSNNPLFPKGYINPFDDEEQESEDSYPFIFSDVDFELKQKPRMFSGFDTSEVDMQSESKSENLRVWQYNRWKTWKYLYELPKTQVVINLEDNEMQGKTRGTVSINGVTFYIMKGIYVDAPIDVAEMIKTSQNQTNAAGRKSLLESLSQKLDPVTGSPKDVTRLER